MGLVGERAHLAGRVERVAERDGLRPLRQPVHDELVVGADALAVSALSAGRPMEASATPPARLTAALGLTATRPPPAIGDPGRHLGRLRPLIRKQPSNEHGGRGACTPARATHDDKRHGTSSLFAALEVASGKVIRSLQARHRAIEFKKFLAKIDREVPPELDVHLILDNYATHKTPAIKRWLQAHPRFHLHFTPTGASWINLVERWFAELTARKLRRGAHRSVAELDADIDNWVEHRNENPNPYAWTKTADQILDNLAEYCNTTDASRH